MEGDWPTQPCLHSAHTTAPRSYVPKQRVVCRAQNRCSTSNALAQLGERLLLQSGRTLNSFGVLDELQLGFVKLCAEGH